MKPIALLLVLAAGLVAGPARSAEAQITFPEADFSGYSTGTSISADSLQATAAGPRLAGGEAAFSAASVASQGFAGAVLNEVEQTVLPPALTGRKAAGRGIGFSAGPLVPAGVAEAAAPPTGDPVRNELGRVVSGSLASASGAQLLDGGPAPADGSFSHPLLAAGSGDPGSGVSCRSRSFTYPRTGEGATDHAASTLALLDLALFAVRTARRP